MNDYIFIVDTNGKEYSWRVPKNVGTRDIINFLSKVKPFQFVGAAPGRNKKDARARLCSEDAFNGEDITMDKIEVEVN